jgi:hypothetical protein
MMTALDRIRAEGVDSGAVAVGVGSALTGADVESEARQVLTAVRT